MLQFGLEQVPATRLASSRTVIAHAAGVRVRGGGALWVRRPLPMRDPQFPSAAPRPRAARGVLPVVEVAA